MNRTHVVLAARLNGLCRWNDALFIAGFLDIHHQKLIACIIYNNNLCPLSLSISRTGQYFISLLHHVFRTLVIEALQKYQELFSQCIRNRYGHSLPMLSGAVNSITDTVRSLEEHSCGRTLFVQHIQRWRMTRGKPTTWRFNVRPHSFYTQEGNLAQQTEKYPTGIVSECFGSINMHVLHINSSRFMHRLLC